MTRSTKRIIFIVLFTIYIGFSILLPFVETGHEGASILTIRESVWYTLVTITTVGYGDYYPVSTLGKIISLFYLSLSLGILAYLIGTLASQVSNHVTPKALITLNANKEKYIFSDMNNYSITLAKNIYETNTEKGAPILIFADNNDVISETLLTEVPHYKLAPNAISSLLHSKRVQKLSYICFSEDEYDNMKNADILLNSVHKSCSIYYNSSHGLLDSHSNSLAFSLYETSARYYWSTHPLRFDEKNIMILGFDKHAQYLLLQALLVNILEVNSVINYHIFATEEQSSRFLSNYPMLEEFLSIGEEANKRDSIVFHSTDFLNEVKLIEKSNRIIICHDKDTKNHIAFQRLSKRYTALTIHVRSLYLFKNDKKINNIVFWGTLKDICTKDLIIKENLNRIAKKTHTLYLNMCGDESDPDESWKELSKFHKQSNISQADHVISKLMILLNLRQKSYEELSTRIVDESLSVLKSISKDEKDLLCEIEHIRWMRFMYVNNWSYDKKRYNPKRKHNMLVDYSELSYEEQIMDFNAWENIVNFRDLINE